MREKVAEGEMEVAWEEEEVKLECKVEFPLWDRLGDRAKEILSLAPMNRKEEGE